MASLEKAAVRAGSETRERSVVTRKPSRCHSITSLPGGGLVAGDDDGGGLECDTVGWGCGRDSEREWRLSAISEGILGRLWKGVLFLEGAMRGQRMLLL